MSVRKGVAGGPFHTDGGSASGVATMEGSQKLKNTPLWLHNPSPAFVCSL
jgi:hypothetical protein